MSSGGAWPAGSRTSSSSRSAPGSGPGWSSRGELHRGRNGAAGEVDYALGAGLERESDPCAGALSAFAERRAAEAGPRTALAPPFDVPSIFAAARAGDPLAGEVVEEEARRISRHIAPVAAVADVELVVIGGGIGANGDLLLAPIRALLDRYLPVPAAGRGLEPRRRRRAQRGARGWARLGARQRVRESRTGRTRLIAVG